MLTFNQSLVPPKSELMAYFRDRASESLGELQQAYGSTNAKHIASEINVAITSSRQKVTTTLLQQAKNEEWSSEEKLRNILAVTYASYVVMIDYRNEVRPYDYMDFSRRIGELWEPFCRLCFEYPVNDLALFIPPLFSEIKANLKAEIHEYIAQLDLSGQEKATLQSYYAKVWAMVDAGQVQLELDLHFTHRDQKIVVDFKSGFGSNEKGNTNRLLLVASVYKNLGENYQPVLLVRSEEDGNNNYFQTLKKSGIWEAYCGGEAYAKISEYSGFGIKRWIQDNIDWEADLQSSTLKHLADRQLGGYLKW